MNIPEEVLYHCRFASFHTPPFLAGNVKMGDTLPNGKVLDQGIEYKGKIWLTYKESV